MTVPDVTEGPGYFTYYWQDVKIRIDLERIRETRDGDIRCELTVLDMSRNEPGHLYGESFNLSAGRSRASLRGLLEKRKPHSGEFTIDWFGMLEQVCQGTKFKLRVGDDVKQFGVSMVNRENNWLIEPFVPEGMIGTIFGEPGAGKSYLVQAIGTAAQVGYGGFGFSPNRQVNVLVEDYETTWDFWASRLEALEAGMNLPASPALLYDHPRRILADDVPRLHRLISENNIELMIVDSLIPACGGEANLTEPAERFYNALRQLPVSILLVAQTSKADAKRKTIYGNAMHTYESRCIWELRKDEDSSQNGLLSVGLFHRKCNVDELRKPMGFAIRFDDLLGMTVEATDVRDIPGLNPYLPIKPRIKEFLKSGSKTVSQIAEAVDISEASCSKNLSEMKRAREVMNPSRGLWGLAYADDLR